ncbi:LmbE family N-acetylglucosaminyl deacetylase [Glaciihabitans tibetensis]|uniref:LmbE family N-acetylglucosaminyl deacetylase n=1 Tax=Glaciihabitans tibetensis TaxID=1266600 RepID=A0A2T0VCE3_9MICO|nr:PIG-L deacetylase family protein [Glaciihabitans tibetensis]PRY67848.1 LmbE family N-acetylglucosaminyl deacetylase [Glaciihabitans tibetensis]
MFWLGIVFVSAFLVLLVGAITQAVWIQRHIRHPRTVMALIVLASLVAIPASLSIALAEPDHFVGWAQYVIGAQTIFLVGITVVVFALRHPTIQPPKVRRVLAIGAHPDDLELACGGSLARFADEGHEVMAIVMSHGANGGRDEVRENEARLGADTLEVASVSVQDFTDTKMATEMERMVKVIELAVELFKPDVILTHSEHDQHQDHHAVHLATLRAGRRSSTILCYESPSATRDFAPNYFVDVAPYMDAKVAAVKRHKDQAGKPYMGAKVLRGAAVFRGSQARTEQAEGFEVVRALSSGLGDL